MPRGGARPNSGPSPDPDALRRQRDATDTLVLPAGGRVADAPTWPIGQPWNGEREAWEQEWRRPQAIWWEQRGYERLVALYVRLWIRSMDADASASLAGQVTSLADRLAITEAGMRLAKLRIGKPEAAEAAPEPAKKAPAKAAKKAPAGSARARLGVIRGGKG